MTPASPDDTTSLTATFPDAPEGATPPESAMAVYKVRLRHWREAHGVWLWAWVAVQVGVPLVLAALGMFVGALVAAGVALVPLIVVLAVQWSRASDSYWDGYAEARGLRHHDGGVPITGSVPLLRKGDERKISRTIAGRIGDGDGQIAQYTYTEVSTDSDGDRQETDYDFTIVTWQLPQAVADRYKGVYLRRSGISLGRLQDKLAHDRAVELESAHFNKRFDLRVVDEQDDVALYELFSTTFLDWLCHTTDIQWEQVGSTLVVFRKGHAQKTADIDQLCQCAAAVHRRYLEEHR